MFSHVSEETYGWNDTSFLQGLLEGRYEALLLALEFTSGMTWIHTETLPKYRSDTMLGRRKKATLYLLQSSTSKIKFNRNK